MLRTKWPLQTIANRSHLTMEAVWYKIYAGMIANVKALAIAGHWMKSHPELLLDENTMFKTTTKSWIHNVLLEYIPIIIHSPLFNVSRAMCYEYY